MIIRILLLISAISTTLSISAQELKCAIDVNTSQLQGTNKATFSALKEALESYMNTTRFSDVQISQAERIECRMLLSVNSYSDDHISGDLQIQSFRPVYNSSYTTPMLNLKDTNIDFEYREGDQLVYNEQENTSNLTAILDFYAFLILGVDFDSFSPSGGSDHYTKASAIVQRAQSSGEAGWRLFEDNKNRSAILNAFADNAQMRSLLYNYHRQGLDIMNVSPDKGRATIAEVLQNLDKIYQIQPTSAALSIFRDTKLDELVNIFSRTTPEERTEVVTLLSKIYPTEQDRIERIKNNASNSN